MTINRRNLASTKFGNVVSGRRLGPVHPGHVLLADFIEPLGLTRYGVANAISVPRGRIDEICSGKRAVTADTALRLGRFFAVEPQLWMNLQAEYDLERAEKVLAKSAGREIVPLKEANRVRD